MRNRKDIVTDIDAITKNKLVPFIYRTELAIKLVKLKQELAAHDIAHQ